MYVVVKLSRQDGDEGPDVVYGPFETMEQANEFSNFMDPYLSTTDVNAWDDDGLREWTETYEITDPSTFILSRNLIPEDEET